jgi:hypothetical protein
MWSLILQIGILLLLPITTKAQADITCSSGIASFEEYQSIEYPIKARRARVHDIFNYELTVMPGGKFNYSLQDPVPDRQSASYLWLHAAVVHSFDGWQFVNKTDRAFVLKLAVVFKLSGTVQTSDNKVTNHIIFDHDNVTIEVIATEYNPPLLNSNSIKK